MFNAIEKIAAIVFEEFEKKYPLKCSCASCREDILSLVLNRIPPRYTTSEKGELYVKSLYLDQQIQSDVLRAMMEAAKIVEQNPNH